MQILSRYILKEHIGPFFFAFTTITFLLVIEHVPKILDHVIDKNLSIMVALELLGLNLAWMLALSVPMAVLVATLMAFGRLSSDFEITAIKASGVNLFRILLPLLVMGALVSYGMIQFNDKVLPHLNQKARMLWGDIAAMRPTLIFRSGMFITDVPGYLIHIDGIDHTTSRVEGVRITDLKVSTKPRIIVADSGYLQTADNGATTEFTLYHGELHSLDIAEPANYRKIGFESQVFSISGTGSELRRSDSEHRSDREMTVAMLKEQMQQSSTSIEPSRAQILKYIGAKLEYLFGDSLKYNVKDVATDSVARGLVRSDALVMAQHVERSVGQIAAQRQVRDKYKIELYKKYSIPLATLAFILVGAPLGILSRRGGMGVAIAVSIIIFVIYWAFLIGGEDLADRGVVAPFWAMWSANLLLGCIGILLTIRVVRERPLLSLWKRANR